MQQKTKNKLIHFKKSWEPIDEKDFFFFLKKLN